MPMMRDVLLYGLAAKMTDEQWEYADAVTDYDIVFCDAGPGTGKTTLAVAMAYFLITSQPKKYHSALYLFNPTEEDKLGFRPGDNSTKESVYAQPVRDAMIEIGQQPEAGKTIIVTDKQGNRSQGWMEPTAHTFKRGTNFKNRVVIIDEAQNFTRHDLKKTLTRIHEANCKAIVIGHTGQCDLAKPSTSGFAAYVDHFRPMPKAKIVTLTHDFRGWISRHADALPS